MIDEIMIVAKRPCNDKRCPNAGRLYHPAHSTCKMKTCIDRGIAHWGSHRVRRAASTTAEGSEEE